jgi:RimJ/RimL family protein N-acetyltransferase
VSISNRLRASWSARGVVAGTVASARAWLSESDEVLELDRTVGAPCARGRGPCAGIRIEHEPAEALTLQGELEEHRRQDLNRHASGGHVAFTARAGEEIVGVTFLGLHSYHCAGRRRRATLHEGSGYSYGTHVAAAYRGKGVAACLLDALEEHARARGLTSIHAIVAPRNVASLTLYRNAGYVVSGTWRFRRVLGFSRSSFSPSGSSGSALH